MTTPAAYATHAQLLERTNVLRLVQLAVPTAGLMPAVDLVRAALLGQSTAGADAETQDVLDQAVAVTATALADGADLMRGYGVPAPSTWTAATPVAAVPAALVRVNCTLAMHYLMSQANALGEADTATYKATVRLLEQHASGQVALVPVVAADPAAAPSSDTASITSAPSRYGRTDDEEAAW
jgi:phage gp36-like protein